MVMHSMIFKEYKKMEMVDYDKYVVNGVIQKEITLPTIAGKHVLVTDRFTATGTGTDAVYSTYLFGEGAFLSCDKNNYENQYTTNYDPEASAGIDKFYTKQGKVLHPNGLSLAVDQIAKESPTYGLYTITEIGEDFIRVNQELYKSTNLITKVEYPADVRAGVLELLKWDIKNRPKTGVKSETLSRYSVTYFDQDANNQVMGYPVALLGFLKPYIKARF